MVNVSMKIFILVVSSALLWFGYAGLKSGRVRIKGGYLIERSISPVNYWLNVTVYLLAGLGGIGFTILAPYLR